MSRQSLRRLMYQEAFRFISTPAESGLVNFRRPVRREMARKRFKKQWKSRRSA